MKRRVIRWKELPRQWTPILECGHVVRQHYEGLSDEDKARTEREGGYRCSTCERIEHRVAELQEGYDRVARMYGVRASEAAIRFQALSSERTYARSMAPHGRLTQDEELRFAEDLDVCWEEMAEQERDFALKHNGGRS